MIKQEYITIKELGEKLDECDINLLIGYVGKAVSLMENIPNVSENDIIKANNIRVEEKVSESYSHKEEAEYGIEVTDEQIDIWKSKEDEDSWSPRIPRFCCGFEIERELKAKAVILYFILKALKNKEMADVKQIGLKDAIDNKNMGKLEESIEKFTARLLIPKSFFSKELGKDIIRLYRNEGNEIVDVEMERNIILAKLQSYGVSENMARFRLKTASFDENKDCTDNHYLSDFTCYYDDTHEKKDPVKEMDNKSGE